MKIFITTDIEGVAMVSKFSQTGDSDAFPEAKAQAMKLLTQEVNAAVDGILDAFPDAEVIVWDGHGCGGIDIMEFHQDAKLIAGSSIKPPYFLDETFDALFFVGQHSMAGTENGNLCHTYCHKTIEYYKINGILVGEFGARAIMAGTFNVPTVFISGDDKAVEEAKKLIPKIYTSIVKWGLGRELALHLSPKKAQELIRKRVSEAVKNIKSVPPVKIDPPYIQEIRVFEGVSIDDYTKKGAKKIDKRTVKIQSNNICDLFI